VPTSAWLGDSFVGFVSQQDIISSSNSLCTLISFSS